MRAVVAASTSRLVALRWRSVRSGSRPTTGVSQTGATLRGRSLELRGEHGVLVALRRTPAGSETRIGRSRSTTRAPSGVGAVDGAVPNTTYHFQLCARDGGEPRARTAPGPDVLDRVGDRHLRSRSPARTRDSSEIYTMSPAGGSQTPVTDLASRRRRRPGRPTRPGWRSSAMAPAARGLGGRRGRHRRRATHRFAGSDWHPTGHRTARRSRSNAPGTRRATSS